MDVAVIVFPGSNCDQDVARALYRTTGQRPLMVWHKETAMPCVDLIVLPGGFSYGDYLRCGAIAAHASIMTVIRERAAAGVMVLGICNGFQILTEARLLPGALVRNTGLRFICRDVSLKVTNHRTLFTSGYTYGQVIQLPIAHTDGAYTVDHDTLARMVDRNQIAFRYCEPDGSIDPTANPNGSVHNIAGVLNEQGNVLGLMPHPERLTEPLLGGTDGQVMFTNLLAHVAR